MAPAHAITNPPPGTHPPIYKPTTWHPPTHPQKPTCLSSGNLMQMLVASTAMMLLVIIPAANDALGGKAAWGLFVVTLVLEPSTGILCIVWHINVNTLDHRLHTIPLPLLLFNLLPALLLRAGGVVFKSLMRLAGTALGALAGLGGIGFAVLCNGLSYENTPAKVRVRAGVGAVDGALRHINSTSICDACFLAAST